MKKLIKLMAIVAMHGYIICQVCYAEYTEKQKAIEVIALTLWAEARGEGETGILAVASVIQNRAIEQNKSAVQVCLKPKQFSCWNTGKPKAVIKTAQDRAIWAFCESIATDIYTGKFEATTRANHYFAHNICKPSWAKSLNDVQIIKNHTFGRI